MGGYGSRAAWLPNAARLKEETTAHSHAIKNAASHLPPRRRFCRERMCYRYSFASEQTLAALCQTLGVSTPAFFPRYNVALTQRMPVVAKRGDKPELAEMAFGWTLPARNPGEKPLLLANARAETLAAKPAFRAATQHRRCLVPADGFYEWEKSGTARLPHYFYLKQHEPFFFAGLWQPGADDAPAAFAIVTTSANTLLQPIHDRMPVILGPNSGPAWLGAEPLPPARLAQLCRPLPASRMSGHRVDPRVNDARHEAPDCMASIPL